MKLDLDALDGHIAAFMRHWGTSALRVSLAMIFVWFGLLKPLGLSPAEPLVKATVQWLPLDLLGAEARAGRAVLDDVSPVPRGPGAAAASP